MKSNFLLFAFVAFSLSATTANASLLPIQISSFYQIPEISVPSVVEVSGPIVSFEIGRKKLGCEKFGVCWTKLDPNIKLETPALGKSASGTGTVIGNKLSIEFFRTSMNDETYSTYFSGGNFIVEDDFEMPTEVTTGLGLKSYTIKAGIYPITELNDNRLLVNF